MTTFGKMSVSVGKSLVQAAQGGESSLKHARLPWAEKGMQHGWQQTAPYFTPKSEAQTLQVAAVSGEAGLNKAPKEQIGGIKHTLNINIKKRRILFDCGS